MTALTTPNPLARVTRAVLTDLFSGYTPFEKIFFPALMLLQVIVSLVAFEGWMSFIVALCGMACVILVGKGRLSNYFFGVIQNVFYLVLSLQAFFIGEVTISVFYVLTQFWGLYTWRKNMQLSRTRSGAASATLPAPGKQGVTAALDAEVAGQPVDVQTRRLTPTWIVFCLVLLAAASWGYGALLQGWGSNQPYVDAFTTVIALIAQVLMVYRFREQWVGWLVLNAVQIYLWSTVEGLGNTAMMAMYLGFIANSAYGWYNWTRLSRTGAAS
ncbi:hypothetical protein A7979_10815 [Rothia nasimurium]|uniref:Nicotinamide riboside transporter PnuC n=1 Tax=Rothia nasimurium TaxID=85336 RepID=A0A1Y1RRE0_9MICC|nr:nicotinamide riboside transporter PnuC [Rothia nasimurium]ORC22582.1 hypothetical protein A7979_10815 [Rothia nasimurium]